MACNQRYANGQLVEQRSNATLPGDPTPAGYTAWDGAGNVTTTRALTAAEAAQLATQDTAAASNANQATLQQQAQTALTANRTFIAAAKPGTAALQASAAYDQAVALSRQMNAVIRLALGQFDGTN